MKLKFLSAMLFLSVGCFAQNDQDALRYSQTGVGGNTRFVTMGGAMGALGANVSCLSYNPAGIAMYRKGELNFSPGIHFSNVNSNYNSTAQNSFKPSLLFNGFGLVAAWKSEKNEDDRHALGVSLNQMQNFNTNLSVSGRAKGKSIMQDILNDAGTNNTNSLGYFSSLAYKTYLMDYDSAAAKYYGFIDPSKNMLQTKSVVTSGKMNELAIGYAYTFADKLYVGASVGIPVINYSYNGSYTESDDKDSLRIYKDANGLQSTYSYPVIAYYADQNQTQLLGGFKSMNYLEKYKTSGSGYNLKLGGIYRLNDFVRIGMNYQTPTVLNLTDTYSYSMTTTFDSGTSITEGYPDGGGVYKYKIITPQRYGASIGFIYKKYFSLGIDYEHVNYGQAYIFGLDNSDFTGVNKTIHSKYGNTSNLRAGLEINAQPVVFRLGWASYGSPFGQAITGTFVRNSYSAGIGFRNNNWSFDFGLVRQMYSDDYYMYNPKYVDKSILSVTNTNFVGSVGLKF
jgi:hypothetical protein